MPRRTVVATAEMVVLVTFELEVDTTASIENISVRCHEIASRVAMEAVTPSRADKVTAEMVKVSSFSVRL